MNEKLEQIKEFIQNDVNNTIPSMCREFAELCGDLSEFEVDPLIKDCLVSMRHTCQSRQWSGAKE